MAELKKMDVGSIVRGMLDLEILFQPGPLAVCPKRLAVKIMQLAPNCAPPEWAVRHFNAAEEQHANSVRCQVHQYIHQVLWLRFTDLGVEDLARQLRLWSQAVMAAITLSQGKEPSVGVRALCLARVALYLAEHPGLNRPEAVEVKLVEVPKPGQPGLMSGGVPQIMEKRLVLHGMYNVAGTASEVRVH